VAAQLSIRILTPRDAPAFRALRLRALQEHPDAFTSSFEEDVDKPLSVTEKRIAGDGNVFWGAFVDDGIRGMVGLLPELRAKNRHKGDIVAMYVAPEFSRRGLGAGLLQAAVDYARVELRLEQLVLSVTRTNEAAAQLYRAAGFRTFGMEPRAIKVAGEYFDKERMILFL
jgi:ribosomal protein S18 acetylase RimI-like enzyme